MNVEEGADAVRRHGELAAAIEFQNADSPQDTHRKRASQDRPVAEQEVIRTSDPDFQPAVRGQSIIDAADARPGLADRLEGFRAIRLALVLAQEKLERLRDALGNDTAEWGPVHVDPRLAARIIVAELQGRGTAE